MIEITREIAEKVRDTVAAGLVSGVGDPVPGKMCVEAAVCYALGLPHGDDPGCVSAPLRRLKIRLNDSTWSSNASRASGLRRLAVAQLGSAGVLDGKEFTRRVVEMTIRKAVPVGLRAAASRNPKHAEALEAAAVRCEQEGTREAAQHAREIASAASSAAYDADAAAASAASSAYAADAYADAAAADASAASSAYAADAYAYAAAADADAADADAYAYAAASYAADAYAYAAAARTRDRVLAQYAEWVVEILIDMQAPGCQWLELVPLEPAA